MKQQSKLLPLHRNLLYNDPNGWLPKLGHDDGNLTITKGKPFDYWEALFTKSPAVLS